VRRTEKPLAPNSARVRAALRFGIQTRLAAQRYFANLIESDCACSSRCQVNMPAVHERPAIANPHDNTSAVTNRH
jgi:hypothetical protein